MGANGHYLQQVIHCLTERTIKDSVGRSFDDLHLSAGKQDQHTYYDPYMRLSNFFLAFKYDFFTIVDNLY